MIFISWKPRNMRHYVHCKGTAWSCEVEKKTWWVFNGVIIAGKCENCVFASLLVLCGLRLLKVTSEKYDMWGGGCSICTGSKKETDSLRWLSTMTIGMHGYAKFCVPQVCLTITRVSPNLRNGINSLPLGHSNAFFISTLFMEAFHGYI